MCKSICGIPWMPNRRVAGTSARSYDTSVWERWTVCEGVGLTGSRAELARGDAGESRTILTAEANAAIAPVHDRVPAILRSAENDGWLAEEAATATPPAEQFTLEPAAALSRATAAASAKVLTTVGKGGLPDDP